MKKIRMKRLLKIFLSIVLLLCCIAGVGNKEADAAQNSLKIKVGFYGGPFYEIYTFSYSEMCSLADEQVYIYSGADSGGFMRIAYAWGVPLRTIVDEAGVDLDSVKYLHMTTADNYGEGKTTFSVGTLLNTRRYFYPNMVKMVTDGEGDQQTIRFDEVTSEHTDGAERVPTILAIGSTKFSREEAVRVGLAGEYASYSVGELPQDHQYRLMFGQTGLSNVNQAANAQTNDKWVTAVDIQLAGAPNITVEKELVSGEEGKIGSKYSIKLDASLPGSYSYIPDSVRRQLLSQILGDIELGDYDNSVVKVSKDADGYYTVEIIGEGTTELNFSYSRTDYDGTKVKDSTGTTMTGTGNGSGGSSQETESEDGENDNREEKPEDVEPEETESENGISNENEKVEENDDSSSGLSTDEQMQEEKPEKEKDSIDKPIWSEETLPQKKDEEKNNTSTATTVVEKGKKWMTIRNELLEQVVKSGAEQEIENKPIVVEKVSVGVAAVMGAVSCLGFGFVSTMITYYKRR